MRIQELNFERYGIFTDRKLAFHPEAALHVVLGANEAGKTSALSGIGDLLFGFSGRTEYDFKHDSKTLRIGGILLHSDGRAIAARRRKGNKNTLVDESDQPLPDDFFEPMLGGLSRDVFSREFGLTARALREGGEDLLSTGGRLAETLAASSAGMSQLSRIKEKLKAEADNLFTPTKSASKPFYLAAKQREVADKRFRDATFTRDALQQSEGAVQKAGARLEALNTAHAQSGGTIARWERTLRVRSHLARLESLDVELSELADLPSASARVLSEWGVALQTKTSLEREIAALDATEAAEAAEIAAMALNEPLLSEGVAIDALRERLGAVRKEIEDIPRRRQARDTAETALEDAARRLGFASHAVLLAHLPTDPALARVRELIEQRTRSEQAIGEAEARCTRAQQERDEFTKEEDNGDPVVDNEHLRQRFDALGDLGALAERFRRDQSELSIETEGLAATLASLDPSPGLFAGIRALPLPDNTVIAKYAHAAELSDPELKRLGDAIVTAESEIAGIEGELARLSSSGAVPARADLVNARRERDTHFNGLRAALEGDRILRLAEYSSVVRSSQMIDSITDLLLTDTERATRREDAQLRLAETRGQRERDAAKLASLQARLAQVNTAWVQLWSAAGLAPRSPTEMLRWRERLDGLLTRLGQLDARRVTIDTIMASLESGKAAVIALLESLGRVPDRTLSPDFLYREAKARLDELAVARTDAKLQSVAKQRTERDLTEAVAARDAAHAKLAEQVQGWQAAMTGIGLAGEASIAQAEAALAVWQSVALPKASYERESRSVESMETDLQVFERDVFAVLDRVAPVLKGGSAQESLGRLSIKLTEARSTNEACRRLREAAVKRAASRNGLAAQLTALGVTLDEACRTLGASDVVSLPGLIERVTVRLRHEDERAGLKRDLYEIADGHDEDALRQERDGLDLDQLPGEIDREKIRQEQLLKEIAEASADRHQKQADLSALTSRRDTASAAIERVEADAELLSIAERWLLRAAASRLAARAIERYRAMVQDPLVERASALFAAATGEAFAGLGVDYSDDDQPVLVTQRNNGERIQIAGLSEGTRDQLFLALRLALLERRTSEPMPFIGDDLLASFDDARTLATLRLLAAAGKQRQIILFTHHRHVAELARSVQGHMIDFVDM